MGGDQRGCVAQMSTFGGHHAKEASDQLQKKLQEEAAMADEIEKSLVKAAAGMNIRDEEEEDYESDDPSYQYPGKEEPDDDTGAKAFMLNYAEGVKDTVKTMSREELEAGFVEAKVQLKMTVSTGPNYKTTKWDPIHDKMVKEKVVVEVLQRMEELQKNHPIALWWVVEWGK